MIYSMTGFGSARTEAPNLNILVEIKTVNHRHLDVHVKAPPEFQSLEPMIRRKVGGSLRRGRVDVFVRIDCRRENVKVLINEAIIRAYAGMAAELEKTLGIKGDLTFETITRLPGAVTMTSNDLSDEEAGQIRLKVEEATENALGQLQQMRAIEGESLLQDLDARVANIGRQVDVIQSGATEFVQHYREILMTRVQELAPQLVAESHNRIEVEALLMAERSDIAEEITRLRSHLGQFASLKNAPDEAGKRMDFILQEMNREVTTLLSKTSGLNDLGVRIGEAAVEIKVEIEKLREQVQNVE